MVKIIEGRHLGSAQSIDRWLADKKSGKKARTDTAHTYFVEQSRLQILLLFFGWCFQSCKAYYMWGEYVVCRWRDFDTGFFFGPCTGPGSRKLLDQPTAQKKPGADA